MIEKVGIEIPPVGLEFEVTIPLDLHTLRHPLQHWNLEHLISWERSDKMFGKPPPLVVVLEATVVLVSALELGTLDLPGKDPTIYLGIQ